MLNAFWRINSEHVNGSSSRRSYSMQNSAVPTEVFLPGVSSRIEQRHQFTGYRVREEVLLQLPETDNTRTADSRVVVPIGV